MESPLGQSIDLWTRAGSGNVPAVAGVDRADSLDVRLVLGHDLRASALCAQPR